MEIYRRKIRCYFFSGFVLFIFSCGVENSDSNKNIEQHISGHDFIVRDSGTLLFENNNVSGSGEIAFINPLAASFDIGKHFIFEFKLEDGGEITLSAFSDKELTSGLKISWQRNESTLGGYFEYQGDKTSFTDAQSMSQFNAAEDISIKIDIHNNESPAHIIFWESTPSGNVSEESERLNSAETEGGSIEPRGRGNELYWGLKLQSATLKYVGLDDAQDSH